MNEAPCFFISLRSGGYPYEISQHNSVLKGKPTQEYRRHSFNTWFEVQYINGLRYGRYLGTVQELLDMGFYRRENISPGF